MPLNASIFMYLAAEAGSPENADAGNARGRRRMSGTAQKDSNKKAGDLGGFPRGLRHRASLPVSLRIGEDTGAPCMAKARSTIAGGICGSSRA